MSRLFASFVRNSYRMEYCVRRKHCVASPLSISVAYKYRSVFALLASLSAVVLYEHAKRPIKCDNKMHSLHRNSVVNVVSKASPAVVSLLMDRGNNKKELASGFIVSSDGFIVTCAHAVEKALHGRVMVRLKTGEQIPAKIWRYDIGSDMAVLKLETIPYALSTLQFGDSSSAEVGEYVVALGSPHIVPGSRTGLSDSATFGIITWIGVNTDLGKDRDHTMIQTDAVIFPGNSGGPLLNMRGEVVGVTSCQKLDNISYTYAVPADLAKVVVDKMQRKKRIARPFLGMMISDDVMYKMTKNITLDNPALDKSVAMVSEVMWNSPAQRAEFRNNDIILEVDGKPVMDKKDVVAALGSEIGRTVPIKVWRRHYAGDDYREETLTLYLTSEKDDKKKGSRMNYG